MGRLGCALYEVAGLADVPVRLGELVSCARGYSVLPLLVFICDREGGPVYFVLDRLYCS